MKTAVIFLTAVFFFTIFFAGRRERESRFDFT